VKDERKTKAQLIEEVAGLRRELARPKGDRARQCRTEPGLPDTGLTCLELVDHISDGLYILDADGYFRFVNKAIEDRSGIPREKFCTLHYLDVVLPQYHDATRANVDRVMKGEEVPLFELEYATRDGRPLRIEVNSRPIFAGGKVVGLLGISRDVTARARTEEALEESQRELQVIHDSMADAETRQFVRANPAFCRMLGYARDELLTLQVDDIHPPDELPRVLETFEKHIRGEIAVSKDIPCLQKDGSVFFADIAATTLTHRGRLCGLAIFRNTTERKRAEDALRESEARYRAVVEDQTELICRFLPDCTLTFVNEAYCRYFGSTREEMTGINFLPLIPDEDRGAVVERFASITPDSPLAEHEHRAVLPDGQVRWMHWTNRGIFDGQDHLVEFQAVGRDVTERKRAEEAHRKAADELSLILGAVGEHVILHSPSMQIVWASQASAESAGTTPEQLKGRHCYEVWQQSQTPCEGCPVQAALQTGKPQRCEMTTPDGRIWDVRGYPVYEDDNTLAGAVEVTLDITERKRVEDALRESEANYRAIFNAVNDVLLVHDIETGDVVDFNPKASEVYGYRPEEIGLLNAQFHERAEPPYSYEDQMRWLRRAAEGGPQMFEWLTTNRSGRRFWVEVSLKRATIGGCDRLLAVLRDIGDRKRAEEALRRSEENYRVLFEESLDGIVVIADGRVAGANQAFADIHRMDLNDVLGMPITEFIHPDEREVARANIRSVLEGRAESLTERGRRAKRADGALALIEVLLKRIDWEGKPAIQAIVRDITERVRLEEELRQALKMEAVGQLAGGIAHDFSNLMTGILCHATLLKVENPSPDDVREAADLIEGAAQRATELTGQLLGFARRRTRHDVPVNLNATVETSVRLLSRSLDSHIHVAMRFCDDQALVSGDPVQMEQVILNLAVNARDAMPDGGEMTFITQALDFRAEDCDRRPGAKPGRYVVLSVEDTGHGMSEATRGRVFEPFFTTKPPGKGTGMGLAMVYGIVKDHGGWVELDSEPGRGTAFRVFLPAAEPATDAEAPQP